MEFLCSIAESLSIYSSRSVNEQPFVIVHERGQSVGLERILVTNTYKLADAEIKRINNIILQSWSSVVGSLRSSTLQSSSPCVNTDFVTSVCRFVHSFSFFFLKHSWSCSDCATGTCLPPSVFFSADIDTETMNEWHAWVM